MIHKVEGSIIQRVLLDCLSFWSSKMIIVLYLIVLCMNKYGNYLCFCIIIIIIIIVEF